MHYNNKVSIAVESREVLLDPSLFPDHCIIIIIIIIIAIVVVIIIITIIIFIMEKSYNFSFNIASSE